MVCLGLEPRAAVWKVQTNPLIYGVYNTMNTPHLTKQSRNLAIVLPCCFEIMKCLMQPSSSGVKGL